MSQKSIVDERSADWINLLEFRGWTVVSESRRGTANHGIVELRARRLRMFGEPSVALTLTETWLPGADPIGLTTSQHACYPEALSWHSQFGEELGEEGGERLDVDRLKPRELVIHRHPLGSPNRIRLPAALMPPEAWLTGIERLSFGKSAGWE